MSGNSNKIKIDRGDLKRIGDAAGEAAGSEVNREMRKLRNDISNLNGRLKEVEGEITEVNRNIEELNRRVVEIEEKKARAEKEAKSDIRDTLKERFEEKQAEYERKRDEVLEDYQQGIERIKDRFVSAISGRKSNLDQVDEEFDDVASTREELGDTDKHAKAMNANYNDRLDMVEESREEFSAAVEEFLEDRRATARTVDSLKTPVAGIDDAVSVHVPFWVVGIERNGREEIQVLPVGRRGTPEERPRPGRPYVSYFESHPVHDYSSFVPEVESWVQRNDVRNQLEREEGNFADPSFLSRLDGVSDRFVEALSRFELGRRDSTQGTGRQAQQTSDGQEQRQRATGVAMND
jgi:hypothetical protein